MAAISLKGVSGSLRHGYHCAASLGVWTVRAAQNGEYSLSATVTQSDAFRLTQSPLTFVTPIQGTAWTWPVRSVQLSGSSLTATLGPMER